MLANFSIFYRSDALCSSLFALKFPSNETAVDIDRIMNYKTVFGRLTTKPKTVKCRMKIGDTKGFYVID